MALADRRHQLEMLEWYLNTTPRPTVREIERAVRFTSKGEGDYRIGKLLDNDFASKLGETYGCQVGFRSIGKDFDSKIISRGIENTVDQHKVEVNKRNGEVTLTFKYRDIDDLMAVLPSVEP